MCWSTWKAHFLLLFIWIFLTQNWCTTFKRYKRINTQYRVDEDARKIGVSLRTWNRTDTVGGHLLMAHAPGRAKTWFLLSHGILHLTWCTAVQFNPHGDMSIPATRVNTDTPCCHWWSQCPCHDRSSVIVSNKVLHEKKKWKKKIYSNNAVVTIKNYITCFCYFCVNCCSFNPSFPITFLLGRSRSVLFCVFPSISFEYYFLIRNNFLYKFWSLPLTLINIFF